MLANRLGEKAFATLLRKIAVRDHSFHIVGVKGKEIVVPAYRDRCDNDTVGCSSDLETELERCFDLMAQPGSLCTGMGGRRNG